MLSSLEALQALAHEIVFDAPRIWQVQGLGMLRTYLSPVTRLHIWHEGLCYPDADRIHTHPWDFVSTVVCGQVRNTVWAPAAPESADRRKGFRRYRIKCGPNPDTPPEDQGTVSLTVAKSQWIGPGGSYFQRAEEIHETHAEPGTVTVCTRQFRGDTEHAYVFGRLDRSWGSAEPREATADEVKLALGAVRSQLLYRGNL